MQWGSYFAVMAATAVKFVAGPVTGFSLGLSLWETIICTWIGMMFTVTIMLSIGRLAINALQSFRTQKPIIFSKRARFAVQIWTRFGVKGIAVMTPLLFTPIGGSLLALSFKTPFLRTWIFMAIAGIFWGIVFTVLLYQLTFLREWVLHR